MDIEEVRADLSGSCGYAGLLPVNWRTITFCASKIQNGNRLILQIAICGPKWLYKHHVCTLNGRSAQLQEHAEDTSSSELERNKFTSLDWKVCLTEDNVQLMWRVLWSI